MTRDELIQEQIAYDVREDLITQESEKELDLTVKLKVFTDRYETTVTDWYITDFDCSCKLAKECFCEESERLQFSIEDEYDLKFVKKEKKNE